MLPKVITNTNFLSLWLAQITSQIGLNALYFVLTLQIYQITRSNTAVSLMILAFTVPSIFFGYLGGVYVDQLSLKKVLVATNVIRAIIILLLSVFIGNSLLLFFFVFLLAFATVFFIPAEGSAIPALVEEKLLISANSLFSLTLQLSLIIGFLLGGISLNFFGEKTTIFIIFDLFILSLILNLFLPGNIRAPKVNKEGGFFNSFLMGLVVVIKSKHARDAIIFLTLTTTIVFILATIGPGYVDKVLKLDIKYASALVIAPAVVGMAVGSVILSHFGSKINSHIFINAGLIGFGVTFFMLALLGNDNLAFRVRLLSLFFIFLLGVENAFVAIPVTTDFQKNTPEEFRGRAYGLLSTFISGVSALPVLLSGAIGDLFGVRTVLSTLGLIVLGFGLFRLRAKKV